MEPREGDSSLLPSSSLPPRSRSDSSSGFESDGCGEVVLGVARTRVMDKENVGKEEDWQMPTPPPRVHTSRLHRSPDDSQYPAFKDPASPMDVNKPLPRVPQPARGGQRVQWDRMPLRARSSNPEIGSQSARSLHAKRTGHPRKPISKSVISRPLLQVSSSSSGVDSAAGFTSDENSTDEGQHPWHPLSSVAAVEDLGKKLEGLMAQQASSQAAASKDGSGSVGLEGKSTPSRRNKTVLGRVKHALRDCPIHSFQNRGGTATSTEQMNDPTQAPATSVDAGKGGLAGIVAMSDAASEAERSRKSPRQPYGPFLIPRKPVASRDAIPQNTPQDGESFWKSGAFRRLSRRMTSNQELPQLRRPTPDPETSFKGDCDGDQVPPEPAQSVKGVVGADMAAVNGLPGTVSGHLEVAGKAGVCPRIGALPPGELDHSAVRTMDSDGDQPQMAQLVRVRSHTGSVLRSSDLESNAFMHDDLQRSTAPVHLNGSLEPKRKNSLQPRSASESPVLRKKFRDEHLNFI